MKGVADHVECDVTVHGPLTADPGGIVSVVKHQDDFGVYDLGT